MDNLLQLFRKSSAFNGSNANFVEDMYEQYLNDPDSVSEEWREQFHTLNSQAETMEIPHSGIKKHFAELAKSPAGVRVVQGGVSDKQSGSN